MKVCMFTNTYSPHVGGVARSVQFFAEDLQKMGNEVLIIAPTYSGAEEGAPANGINNFRVPAIQNFNGSDFSVRIPMPFLIDDKIHDFRPDIIHSHHPFLLGDAAIRAAFRRRLPLVFTHHTLYEQYTHYVSADSEIMRKLAVNLSTEYANLCTRVIAPSASIAELIRQRGVKTEISIIPTGVDIDFFRQGNGGRFRAAMGIPAGRTVIGHVGRLAPEKNLDYLCKAVIKAIENCTDEVYFLVVGSGPCEAEIKAHFWSAGIPERLVMAGKLSGRSLADSYNAMDVFVFSSQSETQGMVLSEALAAGLPLVALDGPGVREVVHDGHNGRLMETKTPPHRFGKILAALLNDTDRRKNMAATAREDAISFSRKTAGNKLFTLYQNATASHAHAEKQENNPLDILDALFQSLQTEWEILSEKASAVIHSIQ
jgi:1,2-diacylglycerol 3-alpha-glucosyltransferase